MREDIVKVVADVIAISDPAPTNETETCERIIYPLIKGAGYSPLEIKSQDRDAAKQKPDYTILPNTPDHTWFLEAKSWGVSLDDNHVVQAINYANTQGKRWVILSNGREWRLYDNKLFGTADKKHVCTVDLMDETFASFLEAMSKPSITQGKLEGYVSNERLYACLNQQLTKVDSEIIRAIGRVMSKLPGLNSVSLKDIVDYFKSNASSPKPDAPTPPNIPEQVDVVPVEPEPNGAQAAPRSLSLAELESALITGRKVALLRLPNGAEIPVRRWKDILIEVTIYSFTNGAVPQLPLYFGPRSKSPLVAAVGSMEATKLREPITLPSPHSGICIETHFSATSIRDACKRVIAAASLSDDGIYVSLMEDSSAS